MRDSLDRYYTPDDVAARCVSALGDARFSAQVLEPSCGGGAFVRAIRPNRPALITTCDIDPAATGYHSCHCVGDFLTFPFDQKFDLILGNPPYRQAQAFVQRSLELVDYGGTVAFLLRLGFLASQSRAAFFRHNPPAWVHVLSRRPSFTGDGKTDGTDCAFFVWIKGNKQPTKLGWI